MVRPMANSPPNRVRNGTPRTIRSAPRSVASSTIAAPTSRAWSRTGSRRCFELSATVLGHVQHALDLLGAAGDVGVQRQRPVDLDDVDRDQLRLGVARGIGGEADDPRIARPAVEGDDDTLIGVASGIGHGSSRYHRCRATAGRGRLVSARAWRSDLPPIAESNSAGSSRRYGTFTTTVSGRPSRTDRSRLAAWL